MNRSAQGLVMVLLGGAALKAGVTDLHLRYVKESLQPFLIVASTLLVLAGAMTLWYEWRRRPADPPGHQEDGDQEHGDQEHGHRESRVGWLLVLPVLGLLLVAPPALGSYSATTTGTTLTPEQASELPPLPEYVDPVPLTVLDYAARALWGAEDSLAGRRVELTGFLITDRQGQPYLARLMLSCCAADARPVKVGLAGEAPVGLADDTWVEVVGTYLDRTGTDPINEATIPFLEVESWREVPAPRNPYE
jgi:uncharacterized repeat protein (TIGR03943 family)